MIILPTQKSTNDINPFTNIKDSSTQKISRKFSIIPRPQMIGGKQIYDVIQMNFSLHDSKLSLKSNADRYFIKSVYLYFMIADNFKLESFNQKDLFLEYGLTTGFSDWIDDSVPSNNKNWYENLGISILNTYDYDNNIMLPSMINLNDFKDWDPFQLPIIHPQSYFNRNVILHDNFYLKQYQYNAGLMMDDHTSVTMIDSIPPIENHDNPSLMKFYAEDLSLILFPILFESLFDTITLIYDFNEGFNFQNAMMPVLSLDMNREKFKNDLYRISQVFLSFSHKLRSEFGDFRVTYFMDEYRDTIQILSKEKKQSFTTNFTKEQLFERYFFYLGEYQPNRNYDI